jgi:hypothetical protein
MSFQTDMGIVRVSRYALSAEALFLLLSFRFAFCDVDCVDSFPSAGSVFITYLRGRISLRDLDDSLLRGKLLRVARHSGSPNRRLNSNGICRTASETHNPRVFQPHAGRHERKHDRRSPAATWAGLIGAICW